MAGAEIAITAAHVLRLVDNLNSAGVISVVRYLNATAGSRVCRGVRSKSAALRCALSAMVWSVVWSSSANAQAVSLLEVPDGEEVAATDVEISTAEAWPDGQLVTPEPDYAPISDIPLSDYGAEPLWSDAHRPPRYYTPVMSWLGLRHSYTNGRNVGLGGPLVGTSWLNRPYYLGGELGTLWMTRGLADSVSRDTEMFGGVFLGWDWDHYWGSELRFDWATPELENRFAPDAPRTDSFFVWNYSFMYYPWGDSHVRPYWRWGIGNTHVDFPTVWGSRHDAWLLTFPIGLGVKYPLRRWLAARAEFTDQLAVGQHGIPTQHNLTLTFGLEWHFGVRPKSYWPWYPSRHIH